MRRLLALVLAVFVWVGPVPPADPFVGPDPLQNRQWALDRIRAEPAWARATGRGVVVAVVDSGLDPEHPEFGGTKVVQPASCIGARSVSGCQHHPSAWTDDHGHGTHVAGLVAAPVDGRGVVGVAPDARIMPVRVLDAQNQGQGRDVAVGIDYAVAHGADVINLSLSGRPVVSQAGATGFLKSDFVRAVERATAAGVVVVVAAGNDTTPVCSHKLFRTGPGICVGATDRRDVRSWYSNFGAGVDVLAPGGGSVLWCGEDVLSTHLTSRRSPCTGGVPGYEVLSGTSMAAPHVAGVAALLLEAGVPASRVVSTIRATADDLGAPGLDPVYGYGRVNAWRAVHSAT